MSLSQQASTRTKPHLNIGTIGHLGHGKTTLTSAITKVLAARGTGTFVPVTGLDRAPEELARGGTVRAAHLEYETDVRHYAHTDLPGHAERVTRVVAGLARLDGAVLVVSAVDGVEPQTVEHVLLARRMGVEHLVVALSKTDAAQPELTELVELRVRELLSAHGYPGELTPVARVSALGALSGDPRATAGIEALLDAVDTYLPDPARCDDAPFLLPVERMLVLRGVGAAVTGTVERGSVRLRDLVEVPEALDLTVVTGLESFGRPLETARAGDRVALLLRGAQGHEVRRGDVVVAPGSVTVHRRFTARLRVLTPAEGGRRTPLTTGCRATFHFRTAALTGRLDFDTRGLEPVGLEPAGIEPVGIEPVGLEPVGIGSHGLDPHGLAPDVPGSHGLARPGETVGLTAVLDRGTPLEPGLAFALREGGRTVGTGTVTAVADRPAHGARQNGARG
ncbi:elongation factor Tu [Streptomyces mobaraensis NBRC 13819 = DSM 40847]|uniref:Elongation factor Tu n=1 Tax=Streptomyces mobaraensis (strain ATCC 29032 / DSM 40847 / JCM 4168 / NBRC 13819 / NCIMB 11159 / IPCR 16-22) TaxID=1223523 RepID=M3B6R8_STRM1|nr:GTP-binding protein [Streptomyces mobaraensis]EMF01703.1 elongation factor Tu [Streptomyces mobaraensis NBRC 13819 = DSM 40847]